VRDISARTALRCNRRGSERAREQGVASASSSRAIRAAASSSSSSSPPPDSGAAASTELCGALGRSAGGGAADAPVSRDAKSRRALRRHCAMRASHGCGCLPFTARHAASPARRRAAAPSPDARAAARAARAALGGSVSKSLAFGGGARW
jgi:hypothetical protein